MRFPAPLSGSRVAALPGVLALAGLLAASAWTGCGPPETEVPEATTPAPSDGTPRRGGTVVIAYASDLAGVNDLVSGGSQPTREILERMFLRLLDERPDYQEHPPSFAPRLAESYEFSEDRLQLTFHLREGLTWSDGTPLTAEDVRWTWQMQIHPAIGWENASIKDRIRDVEVVDPRTVVFHYEEAYPGQLVNAIDGVILPKHAWSALPPESWRTGEAWFQERLVVSGPFTLGPWKRQEEIILERNPRYYEEGLPYLDRVALRVVPDPTAQFTQLLSGEIDFLRQIPSASAERAVRNPNTEIIAFWPPNFVSLLWNLKHPVLGIQEVRQALTLALDRQAIVDTIWFGYAKPGTSAFVSTVWAHNDEIAPWPHDPVRARQMLDELGFRDEDGDGIREKDGETLSVELATNAGNRERVDATTMVQNQLAQVGVEVKIRTLDWNTVSAKADAKDFDVLMLGLGIDTSMDLTALFHSGAIDSQFNYGSYGDADADRLMDNAKSQLVQEDALPYLLELQEVFHQTLPQTVLWESQRLVGVSTRVQGAKPNPISTLDNLREWWVLPEG